MRAVLLDIDLDKDSVGECVLVERDQARHLIKVLRIKKHEEILILSSNAKKSVAKVFHLDRKEVQLEIISVDDVIDDRKISLFLGLPKKEAFETIVRMASEIGIKNLYLYNSSYSQGTIEINDRILKIEQSAMIQSNNPFKINFVEVNDFESAFINYKNIINFSSFNEGAGVEKLEGEVLMVIGPEAGFSEDEESFITSFENVSTLKFDTFIMRAPTAFAVGSGYIQSKF